MKDIVKQEVAAAGIENTSFVDEPFDYMTQELSERDI
jgi:phycobilisome core component